MTTSATPRSIHRADTLPTLALVERAVGSARALAEEETAMALAELEAEARAVRRATLLVVVASIALAAATAWAGWAVVAFLSIGAPGVAALALVGLAVGIGALVLATRALPPSFLGESRGRVERRFARIEEALR